MTNTFKHGWVIQDNNNNMFFSTGRYSQAKYLKNAAWFSTRKQARELYEKGLECIYKVSLTGENGKLVPNEIIGANYSIR